MKLIVNTDIEFLNNNKSIIEKEYNTVFSKYSILHFSSSKTTSEIKPLNDEKHMEYNRYQSVVLDSSRKILSIAPPSPIEITMETLLEGKSLYISEYIEGTFIHLFYDSNIHSWEIATKRAIGGNYYFYHVPEKYVFTYREMFMEACGLEKNAHIRELPFLNDLNINICYGFILQHPENHIVMRIFNPKLYLISMYELDRNTSSVTFISTKDSIFEKYNIYSPKSYDLQKYPVEEYIRVHSSIHTPLIVAGIMITDLSNGQTYAQLNPNYKEMAELRGNHPNIQYQYLCLYRIKKVAAFLQFFPQYNSEFTKYKIQYDTFVTNVHKSYLSYYVKKEGIIISPKFFPTIYEIHHSIFIPSMTNKEKIIIRRKVVKEYIDKFDPAKILFLLNYDHNFTTYKTETDFFEKIEDTAV